MSNRTNAKYNLGTFSANWVSVMQNSWEFRTSTFTLIATWFTWTVKFYASNKQDSIAPDLSVAASSSNEYSVVRSIDLQDWTALDWATWVVLSTSSSILRYEINDNNNNFIWVKISSRTAWSIEIKLWMVNNQ